MILVELITKNPKKIERILAQKIEFNGKKLKIEYGYSEKPDWIDAENILKLEVQDDRNS